MPVRDAIEQVLQRRSVREAVLDRAAEMFDKSDSEGDDGIDTVSPIIDEYVSHADDWIYKAMCPFTKQDFENLWDMIHVNFSFV